MNTDTITDDEARESDRRSLSARFEWTTDGAGDLARRLSELARDAGRRGLECEAVLGMAAESVRLVEHTLRGIDIDGQHRRTAASLIPRGPGR